ncbi:MAG: hypothetical protein J5J06_17395 [Phycisphaerae bacterium]|nr:hypothetical protein [Phycisphaerae bacterium]
MQAPPNLEAFALPQSSSTKHAGCGSCGSATGEDARCGNGLEKIYPTTAVRFGFMRYIGEFSHAPDMKFTCGAKVVIQTRRGIELGEQVSLTCSGCDKSVSRDNMKEWVAACGDDSYFFDAGRILREATAADLTEHARIQQDNRDRRDIARRMAAEHRLPIRVVECESLFGGERIIFFFTSDERVDFRGLVKDLAQEFRTRIEMRQVGARDEARLLADFETCGREVCCKVFLKTLRPISMRMAKLQKATLDPTQVSGRCGRLKCCLRYEHESYEDLDKRLPRVGVRIRTSHGDGVIVNRQVLTQLVQIRTDADKFVTVVAEDILETGVKPPPPGAAESGSGDSSRRPRRERGSSQRSGQPQRSARPRRPVRETNDAQEPTEEREDTDADGSTEGSELSGAEQDPAGEGRGEPSRRRRRGGRRRPRRPRRSDGEGGASNDGGSEGS